MKRALWYAVALAACAGCGSHASASTRASASPSASAVVTTVARQGVLRPSLQIAGVIAPYREVGIAADLNEPFTDVNVQEGDHVVAGQVLARQLTNDVEAQLASAQRIVAEDVARYSQTAYQVGAVDEQDVAAINTARATLRQAQVNLAGALTDLRRYASLERQGYISNQALDEQRVTVASDQQAIVTDQATLAQALTNARANGRGVNAGEQQQELQEARAAADAAQASVEQLKRQIGRATIVAPVGGVIEAMNVNPGEYPSGREIFTIEEIDRVYAILPASSAQVLTIRQGASATVQTPAANSHVSGSVVAILDQIQPGTTNFTVKVLLSNPGEALHAGMPVTATVAEPPVDGIIIPITAFVDDTRSSVYAVRDGIVHQQNVTDVKDDGASAVVTGLESGTPVVKDVSASNVGNGDKVKTPRTARR